MAAGTRFIPASAERRSFYKLWLISIVAALLFIAYRLDSSGTASSSSQFPSSREESSGRDVLGNRYGWNTRNIPKYCREIINNPLAYDHDCGFNKDVKRCSNGTATMFGEHRQDWYLYTKHFRHLKRKGIYMDVAANDPVYFSNTFFLDECLGWSGLCVDGNPRYVNMLYLYRTCAVVPTCVSATPGEKVNFALQHGWGGIVDTNKNTDLWTGKQVKTMKLDCATMGYAMERVGLTVVDYLNLDVEGHELRVLMGFDWDKITVKVMTVETTEETLPEIESFLARRGYKRHVIEDGMSGKRKGLLHDDAIFLHRSVTLGRPE